MEQDSVELREYWRIIRKRWLLVISVPILAALVSGLISFFYIKPTYEESTTLLVNNTQGADVASQQYQTILASQALVNTYTDIIKSNTIEQSVINDLHLSITVSQLDSMIKVTSPNQSQVIQVSVTNHNPQLAAQIANQLATAFQQKAASIMSVQNVQVIDAAMVPAQPAAVSPNKKLNVAIAFILGLMVSVGIAFLMEYLDYRLRTEDEVRRYLQLPVLGAVADFESELKS